MYFGLILTENNTSFNLESSPFLGREFLVLEGISQIIKVDNLIGRIIPQLSLRRPPLRSFKYSFSL